MARILVEVDNAAGALVTEGPIRTAKDVRLTRVLDGPGKVAFSVPLNDERALLQLTNERRVRIIAQTRNNKRVVGEGIIRDMPRSESSGAGSVQISGPDAMDALKDIDVGRNLTYSNETLQNVVNDLVSRVGWSAVVEDEFKALPVSASFYAVTPLKALQRIVENFGLHLRLADTAKTIEVGAFGQSNGLRIIKSPRRITDGLQNNPDVLLVEQMTIASNSQDLVNVIEPVSGTGVSALTLEAAYENGFEIAGYPIRTAVGNDGETVYTVEAPDSITEYGTRRRTFSYSDIQPVSNTDADVLAASIVLYRAAVADLKRMAVVQQHYSMSVRNVTTNVRPGDKVHIRYTGRIYRDGEPISYADINDDFWIVKVTESIGDDTVLDIEVNNVDNIPESPAKKIVATMNEVRRMQFQPKTSTSPRTYPYQYQIAPDFEVTVPIEITSSTLYLKRVRVRVQTSPFRATAKAADDGGDHRHLMFKSTGNGQLIQNTSFPVSYYSLDYKCQRLNNGVFEELNTPFYGSLFTDDIYTFAGSGAHTHPLAFGITDDTQHPQNLSFWINGSDFTDAFKTAMGVSTFAPSDSPVDFVLDEKTMTDAILNATGGFRRSHELEIRCAAGQGRVQVTVEIYEVLQEIAAKD